MKENLDQSMILSLLILFAVAVAMVVSLFAPKSFSWIPRDRSEKRCLHMTYHSPHKIPAVVFENISRYAPEFDLHIYDDAEAEDFVRDNFDSEVWSKVVALKGAHKADLIRYCLLYVLGGVYLDVKTELIKPLSDVIPDDDVVRTALSATGNIYQGVLAAPPGHPFLMNLIDDAVVTPLSAVYSDYHIFLRAASQIMARRLKTNSLTPGIMRLGDEVYHLYKERCSDDATMCHDGVDRYGQCCFICEGDDKVVKVRRSSYPW